MQGRERVFRELTELEEAAWRTGKPAEAFLFDLRAACLLGLLSLKDETLELFKKLYEVEE
ncbi:hypothetical protein [Thermosulfurimonas sp. F29]|uniref:hypothetical protein n=1 Tax=Thermosulfurimonas sp. F29 TaxID=2867247 RepID=UPI001C834B49|nr:hypothetical protein [Thermosulfurimonas sp. F29]MBX6423794.1 hypothetical protein [Thermosulfurimonas sp. F29]